MSYVLILVVVVMHAGGATASSLATTFTQLQACEAAKQKILVDYELAKITNPHARSITVSAHCHPTQVKPTV